MRDEEQDSAKNPANERNGISKEDFSLMVHDHLNEYISLADKKASVLLSAQLAFIGLSANVLNNIWGEAGSPFKILSLLAILFVAGAAFFAAKAVYPNTPETAQGLVLWASIVKKGEGNYLREVKEKSDEELLEEVIEENYKLAEVADRKYNDVRWTLWFTAATIVITIVSGAVLFT